MNGTNLITVFGRLGRNPELRYTLTGKAVCVFTLAENIEGQAEPKWHRIVVWEKQAERCPVNLRKGDQVIVRGRIVSRSFKDKSGDERIIDELNADFLGASLA